MARGARAPPKRIAQPRTSGHSFPPRHHAAPFEARQQRGDRRRRKAALVQQRGVDLLHRGLAAVPHDAEDGKLEIGELGRVGHAAPGVTS